MLRISDNTATNILETFVSSQKQDEVISLLGLNKTKIALNIKEFCYGDIKNAAVLTPEDDDKFIIDNMAQIDTNKHAAYDIGNSNVSTSQELCIILEELINPKIISKKSAQKILGIMKQYDPDDRIIEFGEYLEIATKSGWNIGAKIDMNIVFADNPFYISVMAKNLSNEDRNRLMANYVDIIKLARDFFENSSNIN
jgi:beta-lactamase class A